jgi:hypothetical protein
MKSRLTAGYRAIFLCLIFAAIACAQAPDAPVLFSPLNGATGVSTATALVWSAANNAASYDVYFGPSYPPPFAANTTGISYDPGTLGASPKYYWQVVARNAAGTTSSGLFSFTTVNAVALPFFQQGAKLVGTGAVGNAWQGSSVALSADGNTAIVGAPADNNWAGAAWVYTRSGSVWTQQGGKLVGTGAIGNIVEQGASVALSADGSTAIVGGWLDDGGVGAAWVFTRSGGAWTQQGTKLVGSGVAGQYGYQGWSVGLSADGNTAIVGGPTDNSWYGAAWVYTRSAGVWSQQGSKLVGSGVSGPSAEQGTSVALSADGNTAIVGGPFDGSSCPPNECSAPGAAWVFTRSGGVWTQQGSKLVGNGTAASPPASQGTSVALSADGNTAIVGGPLDNYVGAAWVYTRSSGVWTQQGSKLVGADAVGLAYLGWAVALSADGNIAIVGGPTDSEDTCVDIGSFVFSCYPGAAWIYTRSGGAWTQQGSKLVGAGATSGLQVGELAGSQPGARQGTAVALSADGNTAIVGGPADGNTAIGVGPNTDSGAGAAWVFVAVPDGPVVSTAPATSIGGNSATLPGSVNPNGSDTQVWFLYATDSSMNDALATPPQDIGSGTAAVPVSASITGLAANVPYYFQAVAENIGGNLKGSILSFTTRFPPPTVATTAAVSIASNRASLLGSVNPNGADTQVWFLYSTNSSMIGALSVPQQGIGSGTAAVPVTAFATGLFANTAYYFQAIAQNSGGTAQGSILSFATTAGPPAVSTSAATSVTSSNASLPGSVNPNGLDTQVWFLYGTNSSLSGAASTPAQDIGSGTAPVPANANVTGLAANTPYYFQAVAQNSAGTSQGSILTFTTTSFDQPPTVATYPATSIASNSATLAGVVSPGGSDTLVWFLYSTNSSMSDALSTPPQDVGSGTVPVPFTANITDLAANVPYYFQAVAQNGAGTAQGSVVTFTTKTPAPLAFGQQGGKLVGTGAVGTSSQGWSVALSADGNTAIVGGWQDNNGTGAVWVYTRSGGVWTQQGGKLVGTGAVGAAEQGYSVALSADGNTAIVGGPNDDNPACEYCSSVAGTGTGVGAVWVFTRFGGVWSQQGSKLVGTGAVQTGMGEVVGQGYSVALSADGNTAIVGGPLNSPSGGNIYDPAGAAWVFTRSGGAWTQQGGKLVTRFLALQGTAVGLSADGNTAIVGAPGYGSTANESGALVYTRSAGVWNQQGSQLIGSDVGPNSQMGYSVALSADGNTALVGGPYDNCENDFCVGAVSAYTRSGGVWTQQGVKLIGTGVVGAEQAGQGNSAALSADGNTAIVGGPGANGNVTAASVYTRSGGAWTQQGRKLVGSGATGTAADLFQVFPVALSADGHTAIVGGPYDNNQAGAAWVFTSPPPAKIGTYNGGQWHLDANGDGAWGGAPPDVSGTFGAGLPGAIPVIGDWNGSGRQKMGVFYQGVWYLDFIGNGTWDGGAVDKQYSFGWNDPNMIPVVGDWNGDGRTKIGIYYQGSWYLDYDGNGVWDGGVNDKQYSFGWAATGVTPMVGDWSGSGTAKVGIYYNGIWYLDYDGNGVWDGGITDKQYNFGWATTGVTPIMGDWNGDGRTKAGIYYNGFWFLDYNGDGVWDYGVQDKAYNFGWSGATPVVGDWSGSGTAKIGVFYNGYWYLDYIGNGVWDGGVIDKAYAWGGAGDTPIAGRW